MTFILKIILVIAAYLLGSVPFGLLFARLFGGEDPRRVGSGNIGATNIRRTAGTVAGALTLAADILKGAIPTYLAFRLNPGVIFVSTIGFAAFFGHLFPVFLRFKGGKGVATACGVMFAISPPATLLSLLVFIIAVAVKRYVSLGSILAAASMPVFLSFLTAARGYTPLGVFVAVFIILKHSENIKRLTAGVENKI